MNRLRLLMSKIYRFFFPIDEATKYKRMGVKIGANCNIQNEVMIDYSHYWLITIGDNVTLAPRVHILAHDASTKKSLGYTKIGRVVIGDNVFIGAGTVVLTNVNIGANSIIGAGSVVSSDVLAGSVAVGCPAKVICSVNEYYERQKAKMSVENCFDESYTLKGGVTSDKKAKMIEVIDKYKCAFVR